MNKIFVRLFLALTLLLLTVATATSAATKPIVTISNPREGSEFLYESDILVSVSVDNHGEALLGGVVASIDNEAEFTLDLDTNDKNWKVVLSGLSPGVHAFTVSAANSAGTARATSSFKVYVNFGQWLPPLAGTSTQMRPGGILPVKFTLIGAKGPLDEGVIVPEVLLDGKVVGDAATVFDSKTGLPYFQLKVRLPNKKCYITVTDPNIKQGDQTLQVTVK